MSPVVRFADVENLVKTWLLTTTVAPLVTVGTRVDIYFAMPTAAPIPSIVLSRAGGAPRRRSDLPEEVTRISFDCWGTSRAQAGTICRALMAELDSLARIGPFITAGTLLAVGEVASVVWLPDPDSDRPRYIVDALVTTVSA